MKLAARFLALFTSYQVRRPLRHEMQAERRKSRKNDTLVVIFFRRNATKCASRAVNVGNAVKSYVRSQINRVFASECVISEQQR